MAGIFDDSSLEIPCPHCRREFPVKLGLLKENPDLTCPGCGKGFGLESKQFRREIAEVEKALAELTLEIEGLGN